MDNSELKWIKRYLEIAKDVAQWSKDPSTKVGSVIVGRKGQIISQGYNGFPRGIADTKERYNYRHVKYKYTIHSEANSIYNAMYSGSSTDGASIYVTGLPVCVECAKAIIQCGIKKVYTDSEPDERWKESTDPALSMLKEDGVEHTCVKDT